MLDGARLLRFARELLGADSFDAMLDMTAAEVEAVAGYRTTWISIFEPEKDHVRVLVSGAKTEDAYKHAPVVPVVGDPMMERLVRDRVTLVVEDAQTDPNVNRAIVEALGNRTIVNVPLLLIDEPFGTLGAGTFGDEGPRPPTPVQLAYLEALAQQLVVAAARLTLDRQRQDTRAERERMQQLLAQRHRLESLGELAGGVAHDFNNLLTVIMTGASLLAESEPDAQRRAELEVIEDAAHRGAELTMRLLALGRRQTLSLVPVDANDLVEGVVRLLRRVLRADVRLDVARGSQLPSVRGARTQLEQVLMNLALNAQDAIEDGGRITIETERVMLDQRFVDEHPWASTGEYVLVTVTDTGAGMPQEVLDRVFDPFFTTKDGRGTGLGLAVCRGIVEQHDGLIHVYSEPDVGTTFRVYLPTDEHAPRAEPTAPAPCARGGDERILVADDADGIRKVFERVLGDAGYRVDTVLDGQQAVEAAQPGVYALVILDAIMPRLSGRAAFERIREVDPEQRVVFTSGYGAEQVTTQFLRDLDLPLLQKPFDPETLLRLVRTTLDADS